MNFLESLNLNFVLAKMPESLSLLIFGICLIGFAILLRRILSWAETSKKESN